jgi:hypothetical protein
MGGRHNADENRRQDPTTHPCWHFLLPGFTKCSSATEVPDGDDEGRGSSPRYLAIVAHGAMVAPFVSIPDALRTGVRSTTTV